MVIGYYPYKNESNKYIDLSKKYIEKSGHILVDFEKINFFHPSNVDCVILNWYDSVNSGSSIKVLLRVLLRLVKICSLKRNKIKVIFTFHNRVPHDLKGNIMLKITKWFFKWMLNQSDKIIVLTENSKQFLRDYLPAGEIQKKCFCIPHPNYIGVYGPENFRVDRGESDTFDVLFVGQIKRYKNVELIIDVASELEEAPIHFTIAGKAENEEYAASLQNRCKIPQRIDFDFRFISDEEMPKLIQSSDILLLPYDIKSSMNSGTVILAFSNKRSVICPKIPTLDDYDEKLYFSYTYENEDMHKENMRKAVLSAYNARKKDPVAFYNRGYLLYDQVKEKNSEKIIVDRYRKLFLEM